ncbi:MAG: MiaB/RimO family radical SAM methylthiotransferase, partial [Candidatus Puniceispirillaceae bacterium]
KFCSFCVVPYTRGAEFSRPADQILAEARRLVASGTREITLLGQNVNAWHGQAGNNDGVWGLGRLLRELAEIDGLDRLRYTTSHPLDMDEELMTAHRDIPALMPYLHLPVQAGSDKILAAMNRRHKADDYRRIIDRLRELRPDIALSGDFIVGFPGESDKDFADTIKLVSDIGYASAYSFKYSARPGTPASGAGEQIEEKVKSDRLAALQQLLDAQQLAFNKKCEGMTMSVLIEKQGGRDGQMTGRSPFMQSVYLEGEASWIGRIMELEITQARQNSLWSAPSDATAKGAA